MLTKAKQRQLLGSLKDYHKQFLKKASTDLDESGTRLMINSFLTDVLGYAPIEEVKTEYMIRGTYADYVLQIKGTRHFLVEVKAYYKMAMLIFYEQNNISAFKKLFINQAEFSVKNYF